MKPEKGSKLYNIRHSLAHMLAEAVLDMFPDAKLGTGPVTENGFYYDFELPRTLIPEDLPLLQKRMKKYVQQGQNFVRRDEPIEASLKFLKKIKQPFKIDLVKKFVDQQGIKEVSFYENFIANKDEPVFVDLCEGGHVENTKEIDPKSFKLSHISAAYWQADENNASMQRIYGLSFETAAELQEYEQMMAEAKKRDHRKLGQELQLFTFSENVGPGLPLFYPKGETVKYELEQYMREEKEKLGYSFVTIPHIAKRALYEKSGHMGKYDAMMPVMTDQENHEYVMKAMNCPHHFELYSSIPHSYRDLPLRYAENTTCYRNEKSGELSGLTRVKALTQDDTHHFVRHDQIQSEIEMILGLMERTYKTFGFEDFKVDISIRDPEKKDGYFGDDKLWEKAEQTLIESVQKWGADYTVEEGEAAFYGPKIDIQVRDAIGRKWQLTTVQLDFVQPENFDMTYIGEDGNHHRPAVLHVAILGSSHRFMGVAIEHFAGAFPAWLAPVQVQIIPVAAAHLDYAHEVLAALRGQGVRVELATPEDSLGKRIRNAEKQKIPYMLVIGDKEVKAKSVNVRSYSTKKEKALKLTSFTKKLVEEIAERRLPERSAEQEALLKKMAEKEKKKVEGGASGAMVKQYIEDNNIPYEGIEHKRADSVLECQKVYGTRLEQQAKALLIKYEDAKGKTEFAVATLPASKQADLDVIQKLLKAKSIKLASRKELKEQTGCIFGEMPPLGKVFGLQLLMDKDLLNEPKVYWNAAQLTFSMVTDPKDIKKLEKPIMF